MGVLGTGKNEQGALYTREMTSPTSILPGAQEEQVWNPGSQKDRLSRSEVWAWQPAGGTTTNRHLPLKSFLSKSCGLELNRPTEIYVPESWLF
jgi:hypothetical protein